MYSGNQITDTSFKTYCKDYNVDLCPDTPSYKGAVNVTDPNNLIIRTYGQSLFDLYSFAYGCIGRARNGSAIPASCTVEIELQNYNYTSVFRNLTYTARGPGSAMQKAANLPSEWRSLSSVGWNATLLDKKTFPYPPVLAVDTMEFATAWDF